MLLVAWAQGCGGLQSQSVSQAVLSAWRFVLGGTPWAVEEGELVQ